MLLGQPDLNSPQFWVPLGTPRHHPLLWESDHGSSMWSPGDKTFRPPNVVCFWGQNRPCCSFWRPPVRETQQEGAEVGINHGSLQGRSYGSEGPPQLGSSSVGSGRSEQEPWGEPKPRHGMQTAPVRGACGGSGMLEGGEGLSPRRQQQTGGERGEQGIKPPVGRGIGSSSCRRWGNPSAAPKHQPGEAEGTRRGCAVVGGAQGTKGKQSGL